MDVYLSGSASGSGCISLDFLTENQMDSLQLERMSVVKDGKANYEEGIVKNRLKCLRN